MYVIANAEKAFNVNDDGDGNEDEKQKGVYMQIACC